MGNTAYIAASLKTIQPLLIVWGTAAAVLIIDLLGHVFRWRRVRDLNPLIALAGTAKALILVINTLYLTWDPGADHTAFGRGVIALGIRIRFFLSGLLILRGKIIRLVRHVFRRVGIRLDEFRRSLHRFARHEILVRCQLDVEIGAAGRLERRRF